MLTALCEVGWILTRGDSEAEGSFESTFVAGVQSGQSVGTGGSVRSLPESFLARRPSVL